MSRYDTIRLPMCQQDGRTVHQTLDGEWLVGMGDKWDQPLLSQRGTAAEQDQWGLRQWFVIRSASAKLVVYRDADKKEPATIAIYDSFEAMEPHVPPSIYQTALERAGLAKRPQFTEIPLEGV